MTGFGHATVEHEGVRAEATVRSLNHRFLEVSFRGTRNLASVEQEVRAAVQKRLQRGRVEVSVSWERRGGGEQDVRIANGIVAGLAARSAEIRNQYGIAGELTIGDVLRFPGAVEAGAEGQVDDATREAALALITAALDQAATMRRDEGRRIEAVLRTLIANIETAAAQIATLDGTGREERRALLRTRVQEVLDASQLQDGRAYAEVAKLVEKADISEELARLSAHAAAAREALGGSEACGKRLDFLAQELGREANTVASKAASLLVVHAAVALKTEIERFREQVQNVE